MSKSHEFKQLVFEHRFSDLDEFETPLRGYKSDVLVELQDGSRFRVTFFDPVRLKQELEGNAADGTPYFAEPGLIVLTEVTRVSMENAARGLCAEGFFAHLRPVE